VAIATKDECLTRGPNVRFDVLELFVVCIVLFDFEVWFQFWFLPAGFFAGHVLKRKSSLKPATTAEFFLIASTVL